MYNEYPENKDCNKAIDEVFEKCEKLGPGEKTTVTGFGQNKNLTLNIEKDSDFDPSTIGNPNNGLYNIVDIETIRNDEPVDDAIGIYCDDQLWNELERIWHEDNFELI